MISRDPWFEALGHKMRLDVDRCSHCGRSAEEIGDDLQPRRCQPDAAALRDPALARASRVTG